MKTFNIPWDEQSCTPATVSIADDGSMAVSKPGQVWMFDKDMKPMATMQTGGDLIFCEQLSSRNPLHKTFIPARQVLQRALDKSPVKC